MLGVPRATPAKKKTLCIVQLQIFDPQNGGAGGFTALAFTNRRYGIWASIPGFVKLSKGSSTLATTAAFLHK